MKALVIYGKGDIRYELNGPDPPDPGLREVTIATSWAGVCGTESHETWMHIILSEHPLKFI